MKRLLLVLLFAGLIRAQNLNLVARALWGPSEAVAKSGDTLYIGGGASVLIVDVSDSGNPQVINWFYTPDMVKDLKYRNGYLYIANNYTGFSIADVHDVMNPTILSTVTNTQPWRVLGIWVEDSLVYVAAREYGLAIYNAADPSSPQFLGLFNSGVSAVIDVVTQGNLAFITDYDNGIKILDITDPANPTLVSSWTLGSSYAYGIWVEDTLAYVAYGGNGLVILNIADPANPVYISSYDPGSYAWDVKKIGNYCVVSHWSRGIYIYDVSDPMTPTVLGFYDTNGTASRFEVDDSRIYLGDRTRGFKIFNWSDPGAILLESVIQTGNWIWGMGKNGNYLYTVGAWSPIFVLDIGDITSPRFVNAIDVAPNFAWNACAANGKLYLAAANAGIWIYDLADPENPSLISTVTTSYNVYDILVEDTVAYVAGASDGLYILNVANPSNVQTISHIPTSNVAFKLFKQDTLIFVADRSGGVRIINVANPVNPVEIGAMNPGGKAYGIYVMDTIAFVGAWNAGVAIYNIADPAHPSLLSQIVVPGNVRDVAAGGHYLFVGAEEGGLLVYDVSDPSNPVEIDSYDTADWVWKLLLLEDYIIADDRGDGLYIFHFPFTSVEERKIADGLSVNPGINTLEITGVEPGNIHVRLYSVDGRKVLDKDIQVREAGRIRVTLNTLKSGIYYYRVGRRTGKVVILR